MPEQSRKEMLERARQLQLARMSDPDNRPIRGPDGMIGTAGEAEHQAYAPVAGSANPMQELGGARFNALQQKPKPVDTSGIKLMRGPNGMLMQVPPDRVAQPERQPKPEPSFLESIFSYMRD